MNDWTKTDMINISLLYKSPHDNRNNELHTAANFQACTAILIHYSVANDSDEVNHSLALTVS